MERHRILNIDVINTSSDALLAELKKGVLYTPNIDHFVLLQKNAAFYRAYKDADYVVLDSQVVFLLQQCTRRRFVEKISGSDFFPKFCEFHKDRGGTKIFLLGGMDGVAGRVKEILNAKYGRELVVGAYSPSWGFEANRDECDQIVGMIRRSGANVLAAALGTPKQELWIAEYRNRLETVDIFMGVGATFDYIAGTQKRAPKLFQKMGLEWFYRILHQPVRLAKRYLVSDMQFFYFYLLDICGIYEDPYAE